MPRNAIKYRFVARQPILNTSDEIVAYELLYRGGEENRAPANVDSAETVSVIESAVANFGIENLADGKNCFINCTDALLNSEAIRVLDPAHYVLEVLEDSTLDAEVIENCRALRAMGFPIALDDVSKLDERVERALPIADIVKIDWSITTESRRAELAAFFKSRNKVILAEKVEDYAAFREGAAIGATLFQGYYFARPEMRRVRSVPPDFGSVLSTMGLIADDAPIEQLVGSIAKTPSLLVHLLRLASAAANNVRMRPQEIGSISTAVRVAGSARLMKWCTFLIYYGDLTERDHPFTFLAEQRAEIMAEYVERRHPGDEHLVRMAHMAGALSLLDVLYSTDREEFWKSLPVAPAIKLAISDFEGEIGEALAFAMTFEDAYVN